MVINPIVGVYIPIIRIPIKGGMTIPNIATFDHGTNDKKNNNHKYNLGSPPTQNASLLASWVGGWTQVITIIMGT